MSNILKSPIYAGKHIALRRKQVIPKQRKGQTYGKSSSVAVPEEEWVETGFPVVSPIVTWERYEEVKCQFQPNREESKRNHRSFYILSGMVFCGYDGRRCGGSKAKEGF